MKKYILVFILMIVAIGFFVGFYYTSSLPPIIYVVMYIYGEPAAVDPIYTITIPLVLLLGCVVFAGTSLYILFRDKFKNSDEIK